MEREPKLTVALRRGKKKAIQRVSDADPSGSGAPKRADDERQLRMGWGHCRCLHHHHSPFHKSTQSPRRLRLQSESAVPKISFILQAMPACAPQPFQKTIGSLVSIFSHRDLQLFFLSTTAQTLATVFNYFHSFFLFLSPLVILV